jgi:hypothetical protein
MDFNRRGWDVLELDRIERVATHNIIAVPTVLPLGIDFHWHRWAHAGSVAALFAARALQSEIRR